MRGQNGTNSTQSSSRRTQDLLGGVVGMSRLWGRRKWAIILLKMEPSKFKNTLGRSTNRNLSWCLRTFFLPIIFKHLRKSIVVYGWRFDDGSPLGTCTRNWLRHLWIERLHEIFLLQWDVRMAYVLVLFRAISTLKREEHSNSIHEPVIKIVICMSFWEAFRNLLISLVTINFISSKA